MISKIRHRFYPSSFSLSLVISGLFLGVVLTCSLGAYLDLVEQLGFRIPQNDLAKDYVVSLVWATILGICIVLAPAWHKDKSMLLSAWVIKCFISLFVLLFYEAHFEGDAVGFWYGGLTSHISLIEYLKEKTISSKNIFWVIQLYNHVVPDIIANSFHSLKISFSMLGLIGIYLFYRTSIAITKIENRTFFWVLLLFPSLLIYTSRIGKESLIVFFMAVLISGIVAWHFKRRIRYLLITFLGFFGCIFIRLWLGPAIVVGLFFYFLSSGKYFLTKAFGVLLLCILMLPAYNLLLTKLHLNNMGNAVKHLAVVSKNMSLGGSKIDREPIVIEGLLDVVKYAPSGMFTALFRPLPWDVRGLLGFLSGLEGVLLLYLLFVAVKRTQMHEISDPIVISAISLVLTWALYYGFAIQNFGTGIRWKTQVLPVFIGLLCYLGRNRQKVI